MALAAPTVASRAWAGARPSFAFLDERLRERVARGYFDGMGLIIGRGSSILHEDYFGDGAPDRVLHVASCGKWTAAAAIAAVVDEGHLAWDDPARKFIPELTDAKGQATLRQLLSHTAGYPDYQPPGRRRDDYPTLQEAVARIVDLPPAFAPGTRFQYGGLAMQVAGRMAELATGQTFEAIFQSRIAHPLGMTRSGYAPVSTEPGFSPMLGGSLFTTTRDYGRFLAMIARGGLFDGRRVLTPQAIAAMERDQVGAAHVEPLEFVDRARADPRTDIYGLGQWREEVDGQGRASLLSSPGWAGAYGWCDRAADVWGFVLAKANVETAKAEGYSTFLGSSLYAPMTRAALADAAAPSVRRGLVAGLYYEEKGRGEPVVLLHGHSLDRTQWDPQFDALAARHRVIRYDLRGYGRSPDPVAGEAFLHVADLAAVLDGLGLRKAHLVGLSLGGFVVTDFLARRPDRVLSAAMAGGDLFDVPGPSEPWSEADLARRRVEIARLKAEGLFAFKRRWFDDLLAGAGSRRETLRRPLWRMIDEWRAWQPLNIEPRLVLGRDAPPALSRGNWRGPTLLLRGDREKVGLAIKTLLPQARVEVLADCGHISNLEQPEAFTAALTRHLEAATTG
jgi:CubicO group peptidase (beta-lactamase class C family)/pimeloyl-ACP methyl ester carboxylesterase